MILLKFVWRHLLKRLRPILKSLRPKGVRQYIPGSGNGAKVLIIAPAQMLLPNVGWGAVESLVLHQHRFMNDSGFNCSILNSEHVSDWVSAFKSRPAIVINHYDPFARRAYLFSRIFTAVLIGTTHYAYAQFREKWEPGFEQIQKYLKKANFFVALNSSIESVLFPDQSVTKTVVIPNFSLIDFDLRIAKERCVSLGKIEPRKRQFELISKLKNKALVTFVGPMHDERFSTVINDVDVKVLDPWSRRDVENLLPNYSVLVITSEAEADALVIHEALAAGLSVVATESSMGSHPTEEPWLRIVSDGMDGIEEVIEQVLVENPSRRKEISQKYSHKNTKQRYETAWLSLVNEALTN